MQWLERQRKEEHRPDDEQHRSPLGGQPLGAQPVEESLHDSGESIRANTSQLMSPLCGLASGGVPSLGVGSVS